MDQRRIDPLYSIENTQSATECTGLMPAMPQTGEEAAQLSELMAIHCPPDAKQARRAPAAPADAAAHPSDAPNPPRTQ